MEDTAKKITGTKEFENTFDEVIAKETKASAEFMNKLIEQLLSNDTYLKALAEQILTKLDNKAAANHNHNYNDLNNKPSLGSAATKSATDSVTSGSSALITSGAVYNALANKLPVSGGTITGNLTLKGSSAYGNKLNFGDGDYVHISEPTDDCMEIKANKINFVVSSSDADRFAINGNALPTSIPTTSSVTSGSNDLITSGGVYNALRLNLLLEPKILLNQKWTFNSDGAAYSYSSDLAEYLKNYPGYRVLTLIRRNKDDTNIIIDIAQIAVRINNKGYLITKDGNTNCSYASYDEDTNGNPRWNLDGERASTGSSFAVFVTYANGNDKFIGHVSVGISNYIFRC